jgi:hypothetical protein
LCSLRSPIQTGRQIRIDRHARALGRLGNIADQARRVIGNCYHGQAFHRLLQTQLQGGAPVHRLQDVAVVFFLDDADPCAQQVVGIGDALGQGFLPLRDRSKGIHGRP